MKSFVAGLFFTMLLGSVAASQEHSGIWLDVPFVKQSEDGCGSASIAMILQYWNAHGAPVSAKQSDAEVIQAKLFSPKGHGIFASDVEHYLQDSGFRTFAYEGKWDDLREQLAKGRPVIIGLQPNERKSQLHYVVVTGLDWEHAAVFVNDPARGKLLRIERADFEKSWQAVRNWMLLAVPQQAN